MKVLIIDNYDSFTYNLVQLVKECSDYELDVKRNDEFKLEDVEVYDKIILSPGPGLPCEAGLMPEVVRKYGDRKQILGVCLGHQCIGEIYGGKLKNLGNVVHGKGLKSKVTVGDSYLFKGMPVEFETGRYHSWVVDNEGFPDCLEITAVDDKGEIMALRHRQYDVQGVQFHPESVLTPKGRQILINWLNKK
jgi:anthranilate synthase component 2